MAIGFSGGLKQSEILSDGQPFPGENIDVKLSDVKNDVNEISEPTPASVQVISDRTIKESNIWVISSEGSLPTFDLTVDGRVEVNGDIDCRGTLKVNGELDGTGNISVDNNLNILGSYTNNSLVEVLGDILIQEGSNVTTFEGIDPVNVGGNIAVDTEVDTNSVFEVSGESISGDGTITGDGAIKSDTYT